MVGGMSELCTSSHLRVYAPIWLRVYVCMRLHVNAALRIYTYVSTRLRVQAGLHMYVSKILRVFKAPAHLHVYAPRTPPKQSKGEQKMSRAEPKQSKSGRSDGLNLNR